MGCPTNEVGSEQDETLLQNNGWFGADLDVMQVEDLFALLDTSLGTVYANFCIYRIGVLIKLTQG
jgi:hypothetical protein